MPLLRVFALLVTLVLPASAMAGDVCLWDASTEVFYTLKNLKIPKKPGGATPVAGHALVDGLIGAAPVSGTLIRDPFEGTLTLGLTRYGDRCLGTAVLDEELNGSIGYDCDLDDANDIVVSLVRAPCDVF
jgi:hypothetical protein